MSYGYSSSGTPRSREEMVKWAVVLAKLYPKCGWLGAQAYQEEFDRVVGRLGYVVPDAEMTDETCVHCTQPRPKPNLKLPDILGAKAYVQKLNAQPLGKAEGPDIDEEVKKL